MRVGRIIPSWLRRWWARLARRRRVRRQMSCIIDDPALPGVVEALDLFPHSADPVQERARVAEVVAHSLAWGRDEGLALDAARIRYLVRVLTLLEAGE